MATAPEDILFYIAERDMSVQDTLQVLYDYPSQSTINHFLLVNSHLKNNFVLAGQMVIVTPENPLGCTLWETQMGIAARNVDAEIERLTAQEREKLSKHYSLLSNVSSYSGTMYGWTNTYFDQKKQHVERVLKQIEKLYADTYNKTGNLKNPDFLMKRRAMFTQLDQTINGMLERKLFGQDVNANRIKSNLGLSSKAIVHQWNSQGGATTIDGFKSNYSRLTNAARTFNRLGYISMALDVGSSAAAIAEACAIEPDSAYCTKTKYTETGRAAGSIAGGSLGGAASSYVACNLIFGLESGGTSLLWCTIVAGVAGGYIGGNYGSDFGKGSGELIYKKQYQVK